MAGTGRKNKNWRLALAGAHHWGRSGTLGLLQNPMPLGGVALYGGVTPYYLTIGDLTNEKDPVVRQWLPCGEE